jgi:hypothetical protein
MFQEKDKREAVAPHREAGRPRISREDPSLAACPKDSSDPNTRRRAKDDYFRLIYFGWTFGEATGPPVSDYHL